jgi:signal transduction histidine kinase
VKDLNENLEAKVVEQTKEVKRAYEVEKKARHELEKLDETKDQLITAAQHNLRTPLTALRWQLEEVRKMVGGEDGNDSGGVGGKDGLREALKESEASVGKLTAVLEDFLKITEMKVGDSD